MVSRFGCSLSATLRRCVVTDFLLIAANGFNVRSAVLRCDCLQFAAIGWRCASVPFALRLTSTMVQEFGVQGAHFGVALGLSSTSLGKHLFPQPVISSANRLPTWIGWWPTLRREPKGYASSLQTLAIGERWSLCSILVSMQRWPFSEFFDDSVAFVKSLILVQVDPSIS